jgi:hypothetical protein
MSITRHDAIEEVRYFVENGGVNPQNYEHVAAVIQQFGENSHEIFQEAAEQIYDLFTQGIIAQVAPSAA